jgi:hydrogenase maturation protein HypF
MRPFAMCADCAREYHDPLNRRFHAQPVACAACGPRVWLETAAAGPPASEPGDPILAARRLLADGAIVAVKGLGGFHLACDATNAHAVAELRRRKHRPDKPLGLMLADLAAVTAHSLTHPGERALLAGRERPIVLALRRPGSAIALAVAPGQDTLGVMLPYTPLHHLLMAEGMPPLVMTSGNVSDEPMLTTNAEARAGLNGLADAMLMHDRDIHVRCDDSVVRGLPAARREARGAAYPLRRARGYAPAPIKLPFAGPPTLAAGGDLKSAFCLSRADDAFLSHYIGDLESYSALRAYADNLAHYERIYRVRPELIAYDLHPGYLSSQQALERAQAQHLPVTGVQHHHAHLAACLADNGHSGERPVIGLAYDGTGYGPDGAVWGGECLIADYRDYQRVFHLAYVPLPGGDQAAREPWRMALAWLDHAGLEWAADLPPVRFALAHSAGEIGLLEAVRGQLRTGLNAPPTSSLGRLFDAVASLLNVRHRMTYEGQAASELEALADPDEAAEYPYDLGAEVFDPSPVFSRLVAEARAGIAPGRLAARFHNTLSAMSVEVCRVVRGRLGLNEVALSGGVWQNVTLLTRTRTRLRAAGFTVYIHRQAPANDGGLALGQAMVALARARA